MGFGIGGFSSSVCCGSGVCGVAMAMSLQGGGVGITSAGGCVSLACVVSSGTCDG